MLKTSFFLLAIDQVCSYFYRTDYYLPLLGFFPRSIFLILALVIIYFLRVKLLNERKYRKLINILAVGVFSNLLSIVFRGQITDYINLYFWKTNLADVMIVFSLFLLIYVFLQGDETKNRA